MKKRFNDATGAAVEMPSTKSVVRRCPDGSLLIEEGGVWRPVTATRDKDRTWLTGGVATTFVREMQKRRGGVELDTSSTVAAPMTGRVVLVQVAVGDAVSRGDTVVVVEAMKMEQPLKAPRDGIVASVKCEAGQLVDGGVILVVLETEPS